MVRSRHEYEFEQLARVRWEDSDFVESDRRKVEDHKEVEVAAFVVVVVASVVASAYVVDAASVAVVDSLQL